MNRPVRQLENWLIEVMAPSEPITISGGFRGAFDPAAPLIPAFELSGPLATTVRLLVPLPPAQEKPGSSGTFLITVNRKGQDEKPLPNPDLSWWKGWAKVLTASALLAPRADAIRLADILQDRRVIRLFCDTNALASGVAEWLLHVLPSGTQLISSAIADKEIMSWTDRNREAYECSNADDWETWLRFQLARRLTEYPPQYTVIDRLSPDQNALMLAQGTAEGGKSSQGDLLFVELARPLVREQPRQARVVFLTGDQNVSRAATSALGPEHVLYANPDADQLRAVIGKVLPRGFWHPAGPLGSLSLPSSSRLLWNLLSAFRFLVLKQDQRQWLIEPVFSVRHGGPSDWADPWVSIEDLSKQPIAKSAPIQGDSALASATAETAIDVAQTAQSDPVQAPAAVEATPNAGRTPAPYPSPDSGPDRRTDPVDQWLLPPRKGGGRADASSASPRPMPKPFFEFLRLACFDSKGVPFPEGEVPKETFRVLVCLEALMEDGSPGPRMGEFRDAWIRNDRDWFHAELLHSHPGYRHVAEQARKGELDSLKSRETQFLPMIRALGQAARFPSSSSPLRMGDTPVSVEKLDNALHAWLPQADAAIRIGDACERAMKDLSLSPCRFEIALSLLWKRQPDYPVEPRTGGEPDRMSSERVVELRADGTCEFREVSPSALTFGGNVPVLFLMRRR